MRVTLDELRRQIVESVESDWIVMSLEDGPIDLDSFTKIQSPATSEAQRRLERDALRSRATYSLNIKLGLVWGLADRSDPITLESARFVDPRGWTTLLGVLWNGTLVDRYVGVVVDGGRAILPFPENWPKGLESDADQLAREQILETQSRNPTSVPGHVTRTQVGVWRTVNMLDGTGSEFDAYLVKSGFVISPERSIRDSTSRRAQASSVSTRLRT